MQLNKAVTVYWNMWRDSKGSVMCSAASANSDQTTSESKFFVRLKCVASLKKTCLALRRRFSLKVMGYCDHGVDHLVGISGVGSASGSIFQCNNTVAILKHIVKRGCRLVS